MTTDGTVTLRISNSYVRHAQVSLSFLLPDLKTAIRVPDATWLAMLRGVSRTNTAPWLDKTLGEEILDFLFDNTNQLKFAGPLSPEDTFLGVPVSTSESEISFQLPTEQAIGKVRILVGSLGTPSGNDWDPKAC